MKFLLIVLTLITSGCAYEGYKGPVTPMDSAKIYHSSNGGYQVHDRYGNKVIESFAPARPTTNRSKSK